MKRALITGILGQDGAYLARLLLNKGYQVFGVYRRTSSFNTWRLDELDILEHPNLHLSVGDVTDLGSCIRMLEHARPQEVYNLAAQSFVGASFDQPVGTTQIDGLGALHLLEAIRIIDKSIRIYQASTAEMFGLVQTVPQTEETPFYPRSPYAVAKLYGHWMAINYREAYGIFASCGILFNHESPLRGTEFVTRKITESVARMTMGEDLVLELGNLDAFRDWGYAGDYVEGMWRLLQAESPDTCIFATGETKTVRDFATMAFEAAGMDVAWQCQGDDERAICERNGKTVVRVAPHLRRPAEVEALVGDYSKAERTLGWRPRVTLPELCSMMVNADIGRQRKLHGVSGVFAPAEADAPADLQLAD
jgi:GDPmannose 4,6-dehydratase